MEGVKTVDKEHVEQVANLLRYVATAIGDSEKNSAGFSDTRATVGYKLTVAFNNAIILNEEKRMAAFIAYYSRAKYSRAEQQIEKVGHIDSDTRQRIKDDLQRIKDDTLNFVLSENYLEGKKVEELYKGDLIHPEDEIYGLLQIIIDARKEGLLEKLMTEVASYFEWERKALIIPFLKYQYGLIKRQRDIDELYGAFYGSFRGK